MWCFFSIYFHLHESAPYLIHLAQCYMFKHCIEQTKYHMLCTTHFIITKTLLPVSKLDILFLFIMYLSYSFNMIEKTHNQQIYTYIFTNFELPPSLYILQWTKPIILNDFFELKPFSLRTSYIDPKATLNTLWPQILTRFNTKSYDLILWGSTLNGDGNPLGTGSPRQHKGHSAASFLELWQTQHLT